MNDTKNLTLSLAIEIVELAKINQSNFSGKRSGKSGIGNESIIAFFSCWRRTFQNAAIFSFNLIYYLNHSLLTGNISPYLQHKLSNWLLLHVMIHYYTLEKTYHTYHFSIPGKNEKWHESNLFNSVFKVNIFKARNQE